MKREKKQKVNIQEYLIAEFENARSAHATNQWTFAGILIAITSLCIAGAIFLSKVEISEIKQIARLRKMDVSFLMKEKPKPKPIVKKPVKKPIKKASLKEEIKAAEKAPVKKVVKRKVYGVRKIYSKGLGSGQGGSDAVVAKLGNSLEVPPDTIKATEEDLKGELVSVTRVSKMPKIIKSSKPDYTTEMRQNGVSGKVKAKVLVDVDGTAKKIIIVKHLGYGTRQSSIQAIKKMKFSPGIVNNAPVAVWIPLTFRFELQA